MDDFQQTIYENVVFPDPDFPVIFHCDTLDREDRFVMHWQDSVELLYFLSGSARVMSDSQLEECRAGDVAVINSTCLHLIQAGSDSCQYYCLIVDRDFLESQGLPVGEIRLRLRVSDGMVREYFDQIVREMLEREPFYRTMAKAHILGLAACLCRRFAESRSLSTPAQDKRLTMVKPAMRYIQEHLTEDLDIGKVSAAAGFSKYYFCRGFKEVTGRTVVDYLNFIRCSHARRLLATGRYNVSEAAERSGFSNLSYFTRTYKRYMGTLPSREEREP